MGSGRLGVPESPTPLPAFPQWPSGFACAAPTPEYNPAVSWFSTLHLVLAAVLTGGPAAGAPPARALTPLEAPAPVPDGRKVALVIGNGAYAHTTRLDQAPADAREVAKVLEELGFATTRVLDADHRAMSGAIAGFERALAGGTAGFFYYAGHAVQIEGHNYLVPVDANLRDPAYADADAVDARKVQRALETSEAPIAVMVLDACRNNPFASRWSGSSRAFGTGGLAQMATRGLLIAYATNPGNTAEDSGVYAQALTRHLPRKCQSLMDAFYQVRDEVLTATGGTQVPYIGGSMGMAFSQYRPAGCDGEPPQAPAPVPAARPPSRAPTDPELAELRRRLDTARELYEQRCVHDLGPVSTAAERTACHARWHPRVQAAQDALDEYLLGAAGARHDGAAD